MDGAIVPWCSAYNYLGFHLYQAPFHGRRMPSTIPFPSKTVESRLYALNHLLTGTSKKQALSSAAIRQTIHQVVYAKALYPTSVLDIDYDALDIMVNRRLRTLFNLPLQTSTIFYRRELGIWPSKFYAHQRALSFAWRLRHTYWTSSIFEEWLTAPQLPAIFNLTWATGGVLSRFSRILSLYDLTWQDLHTTTNEEMWHTTVATRIDLQLSTLCQRAQDQYDLPFFTPHPDPARTLPAPMMPIPLPSINQPLPAYLKHFSGDLARAALRFRYPHLRALPGPPTRYLGLCRICRHGAENGLHLLQCPYLQPHLATQRDSLYELITQQVGRVWAPTRTSIDLARSLMISLRWPHQSIQLLRNVLAFFRSVINMYAAYPAPWEGHLSTSYYVRPVRPPPMREWEAPPTADPTDEID